MAPVRLVKKGKVFDPSDYVLPLDCQGYAQSPQTLIGEDFVRVYFSCRYSDAPGRFISRIVFVEFDLSFSNLRRISEKSILAESQLGSYDEHGIFPFHIFNDEGKIYGYISGLSRRQSVSVESSIGLAETFDFGETFYRIGSGPILSASLEEPFLVCDPFVMKVNETYHMWYIFGLRWIREGAESNPERVYKIGHAISMDQVNWSREGSPIITDSIDENECQALPSVICHDGTYHMFFCFRNVFGFKEDKAKGYRLGYAFSKDLISWTRNDDLLQFEQSRDNWDSDMMCYPHVFSIREKIYLLYNGNDFGKNGFGLAEVLFN